MSLASTLSVPQHLPVATGRIMVRTEGKDWSGLLVRVRAEEPAAQQELVAALWPQVSGRIQGLCPRRDSVEDLAQDVFVKIFAKLWQYRGGVFEAWVDQVTRRVCYDALRKQRVRPEWTFTDVGDEAEEQAASGGGDMNNVDAIEVLAKLFQLLPDEVAWLLREIELKERSISQVAQE
ncbi:RNA polymerase sigma factor, partial [Akkermansiaceae bacterium]|nr:RNA polymerase sigma factor [Akkermansiaceae bacterium]